MLRISLTLIYLFLLTSPIPLSSSNQALGLSKISDQSSVNQSNIQNKKNSIHEQNPSNNLQIATPPTGPIDEKTRMSPVEMPLKSQNGAQESTQQIKPIEGQEKPILQPTKTSQNQQGSFIEGSTQADDGYRCIFRISNNRVYSVLAQGHNIHMATNFTFNNSFSLTSIHSINNFLVALGSFNNGGNSNYVFALKLSTNPSTCTINQNYQSLLVKKGSLIGSRGKDNRLIIISEVLTTEYQYFWLITEGGTTSKTISNKNQSIEGYQKKYVRSIWSLVIEHNLNSYYFQEYFQADHIDLISLKSQNLLLLSNFNRDGPNPIFNIHIIHNILGLPFGTMRFHGNSTSLLGFVPSQSFADEYLYLFRVLARKNTTDPEFTLYVFRTTSLNLIFTKSVSQIGNVHTEIHSCLFIYHNAYLSFPHKIRVYDTFRFSYVDMQNTLFQKNYIHKFKTGASVLLMSFSYVNGKTAIVLYKVLTTGLEVFNTYFLAYSQSQFIDISSRRNYLLSWEYSTIVFSFESTKNNQNQNNLIKKGMCYVHASVYNGCLSSLPFSNCPPSPNNPQTIPPLYKHWNRKLGNFLTAPNEVADGFTLMRQGGVNYLYSSSSNQMQGRRISYNPSLANPPGAGSILNF